jgi:YLP motif-containing protein 1
MVVIVRGPPGAGKTYVSKLLKDKEVANGGTAPRMLCLDDYFVVEVQKVETDPETGKKVKKTVMEYEYDAAMEPSYHVSFLKNFKRQIDECYFNFIIVDAVFDKVAQLDEFWSYAKSKGFQVYVAEVHADVNLCIKRNTHQRKQPEIQKIIDGWEETPRHYIRLDIRSLLQDAAIEDVEMEDTTAGAASSGNEQKGDKTDKKDDDDDNDDDVEEVQGYQKSKWELDTSEQQLDKLDGIRLSKKKMDSGPQRLEDYLQLPDDYESRTRTSEPGKKRVRWADIEERKDQVRRRELGFVVGQTDWAKMTDESYAERALNRTKYI